MSDAGLPAPPPLPTSHNDDLDPLDAPGVFDPVAFFNARFPDEASLAGARA